MCVELLDLRGETTQKLAVVRLRIKNQTCGELCASEHRDRYKNGAENHGLDLKHVPQRNRKRGSTDDASENSEWDDLGHGRMMLAIEMSAAGT